MLAPAPSSAAPVVVRRDGSEVRFVTRQMGVPVEGRFADWRVTLDRFDPQAADAGTAATVEIVIDTGSARFASREVETEVRRPDWLDAARFPQAVFRSRAVRAAGAGRFDVDGSLTLKGQSRPLTVPVTIDASHTVASGRFTLNRLAFGVGGGDWADPSLVAQEVDVTFRFALEPAGR